MTSYGDDVIGKRVEILFDEQDAGGQSFYGGIIERTIVRHHIKFDDGEEHSFDLVEQESDGRLRWPDSDDTRIERKVETVISGEVSTENVAVRLESDTFATPSSKRLKIMKEEEITEEDIPIHLDLLNNLEPSNYPQSITELIRLMDRIEPGMNYYARQEDSRGECSRTRGKLRKFSQQNPTHPAIAHYVRTKKWKAPDIASLRALIALIKSMISH